MAQLAEAVQPARTSNAKVLIDAQNIVKYFPIKGGFFQTVQAVVKAVDDVSFQVYQGETLGLVGESGCGKTTLGRTILQLIKPTSGQIIFEGEDITHAEGAQMKRLRRQMQIIFQDPYASLDPRLPIHACIAEGLKIHGIGNTATRREMVIEMLQRVGLQPNMANRYPHEFSGGQRQRIGIARALVLKPSFIVCDEPVSALDVSIQSQVLNLLKELQDDLNLTYLFVAHDLSVVEHISDRVAVMYLGKMAELATRDELFRKPLHPYTQALMSAIPIPDPTIKRERVILRGDVPSPINPPSGCRFHTRCPIAIDRCKTEVPEVREILPGHFVACHEAEKSL